jgi:hypothetical protein
MKKLLILSLLLLGACAKDVKLVVPEYKVVKAPDELYNCPVEKKFPKSDSLTDQQVGALILKLQKNNITCKNSVDSLKNFYDDAEKTISKK